LLLPHAEGTGVLVEAEDPGDVGAADTGTADGQPLLAGGAGREDQARGRRVRPTSRRRLGDGVQGDGAHGFLSARRHADTAGVALAEAAVTSGAQQADTGAGLDVGGDTDGVDVE